MNDLHKIRIETEKNGNRYLSRIYLDDVEVKGVTAFRLEQSVKTEDLTPSIVLEIQPGELRVEGDVLVGKECSYDDECPFLKKEQDAKNKNE